MTPVPEPLKHSAARAVAIAAALLAAAAALGFSALVFFRRRRAHSQPQPAPIPASVLPPLTTPAASESVPGIAPAERAVTPVRAATAAVLTLTACVLMLLSAALFAELRFVSWGVFFESAAGAALPFALGVIALGGALWWSPWRIRFAQPARGSADARSVWWLLALGVFLLALGTVFGGRLIAALPVLSAHAQFALLLAGVLVTGWALSGAPRHWPAVPYREAGLVAALTVLALALRTVAVVDTVPGLLDELHAIHGLRALWDDPAAPLLRQVSTYLPATILYSYWNMLGVETFGQSLEGLRVLNGVIGGLTVPAVYLLARAALDRKTALAAALLLIAFPPHLQFSRTAFFQIGDAFFGVLALGLFVLALRGGQRWAWAWGGVALGMTQYFFEGGRLLYPPFVVMWFLFLILAWGPRRMRPHVRGMAIALLAAALVALPMYVTMAATGAPFSSRLNESGIGPGLIEQVRAFSTLDPFSQHALARRFTTPFLAYVALPDSTGSWYGNDQPMVLPILVPLLLMGAGFCLWRLRSLASVTLLAVLTASAGNVLIQETLWYNRYVMAMPLLPVLMAIGLRAAVPMLWPGTRWPASPRWRKAGAAVVPVVALLAAVGQTVYFFGPFRESFAVSWREPANGLPDAMDAVLRAVDLPDADRLQVYLITRNLQDVHVPRGLHGFLLDARYGLEVAQSSALTPEFVAALPRDRGYAFFLEPADTASWRALSAAFDLGPPQHATQPLLPADETYLLFLVPPPAAPAS